MLEMLLSSQKPPATIYIGPGIQVVPNGKGDAYYGFYGEMAAATFFDTAVLRNALNLTAGTVITASPVWLKLAINGKTIFYPKTPLCHSVSWKNMYDVGAIHGSGNGIPGAGITSRLQDATIYFIEGNKRWHLRIRSLRVANSNPYADSWTVGAVNQGEWYQIFSRIAQNSFGVTPDWANYTIAELGQGTYWDHVMETRSSPDTYCWYWNRLQLTKTALDFSPKTQSTSLYSWRPVLEVIGYDDITTIPGAASVIAGTNILGHYGEVADADFIDPATLLSSAGLTGGVEHTAYASAGWLKFVRNGNPLYIAKRPHRHSHSWAQLNAAGLVKGKLITIAGHKYKLRLMLGGNAYPTASAAGGEWNDLMYRVSANGGGARWANFSDADLLVSGTGAYSWCQEVGAGNAAYRVLRGGVNITTYYEQTNTTAESWLNWRPVLEYAGKA